MARDCCDLYCTSVGIHRGARGCCDHNRLCCAAHRASRSVVDKWRARKNSGASFWLWHKHCQPQFPTGADNRGAFVRYAKWFAGAFLCASACQAQVILPAPPVNSSAPSDEIRAKDGTFCRNSSDGPIADFGITTGSDGQNLIPGFNLPTDRGTAVYGRLVLPLGDRPKKLDCGLLYRLELERLQLELDRLRREADVRIRLE